MRIIAGEHGGRTLLSPRTLRVRPTSDRVRENIFNILGPGCEHAKVLDLYAGVGTLGLEAISRGAQEAVFVDNSFQSGQFLKRNSEFCRTQVRVIPTDARTALNVLQKKGEVFDIIFLDPPYEHNLIQETLKKIDELFILKPGFVIVAQHSKREPIADLWKQFKVDDVRKYGDTVVTFLRGLSE